MVTILAILALTLLVAWLTHDSNGLNFRARETRRATDDRDRRWSPQGRVVP